METYKIKVSIVILNWNGRDWLDKFLPTVIKYSSEASIFVLDNNSTDDSVELLIKKFPKVEIIKNKENYGYAEGYNAGLKQIDSEYFVLLNSDIEVTKNWISPIISLMESDKDISACQPKILDFNYKERFEYAGASGGYIDKFGYRFCSGRILDTIENDTGQYDDTKEIFWATGACLFIRNSHFKLVNGLDKDFFAHQEEIDLCWRLKNNGYKIMVVPDSTIYHVGGATLNASSPLKTYLNFRNNLYMLFKNLPKKDLIYVLPIRLVLDGVASITFLSKEKGFIHFLSILKAHFSFYINIPKLIKKRRNIKRKGGVNKKYKKSILLEYYLKKKKKFSDIFN